MEILDQQLIVTGSIFQPSTLCREGEKTIWILQFLAFADGGNWTWAACAASECAIHYTSASRLGRFSNKSYPVVVIVPNSRGQDADVSGILQFKHNYYCMLEKPGIRFTGPFLQVKAVQ